MKWFDYFFLFIYNTDGGFKKYLNDLLVPIIFFVDDKNIEITTPSPVESGQATGYDVTPSPYDAASHGVTSQPDVADAYSSEGQVFDESASVAGAHAGSDPYATGSDATTIGSDPYATESEHTTTGSDAVVTGNDPYALEYNLSESGKIKNI